MEMPRKLEDMVGLIGKPIYRLGVSQMRDSKKGGYDYLISPFELKVVEIRIGDALRESDGAFYGPGFVTWYCVSEKGYWQAFSPIGDEILSNNVVAGRQVRGFLNKEDLLEEAEILKECVLQNYKRVDKVEVCLGDFLKGSLEEKIAVATGCEERNVQNLHIANIDR